MSRETIIQKLIESQVNYITRHGCGLWLHNILEQGFKGFGNMSDDQLRKEMHQRGLRNDADDASLLVGDEDDGDSSFEDDDLHCVLGNFMAGDAEAN
jgi:hypothetical protein